MAKVIVCGCGCDCGRDHCEYGCVRSEGRSMNANVSCHSIVLASMTSVYSKDMVGSVLENANGSVRGQDGYDYGS